MMISDGKRKEIFDSLVKWALLSQKELENYCNEENIEVVRLLVSELADENILPDQVTPGSFADLVYKLHEYQRIGSRRLGDAIISAGMAADNGDIEIAIKILEDFRKKSPSAFYKQVALTEIENYKYKMLSDDKRKDPFDSLDGWALLSRKKLGNYCNEKNIEVVRLLVSELADENILPNQVTPGSFADLVYKLRENKRIWSRKLGDAIISAGMAADNGAIKTAIKILEDFREKCPSAFYKQIALNRIENYKMGNI